MNDRFLSLDALKGFPSAWAVPDRVLHAFTERALLPPWAKAGLDAERLLRLWLRPEPALGTSGHTPYGALLSALRNTFPPLTQAVRSYGFWTALGAVPPLEAFPAKKFLLRRIGALADAHGLIPLRHHDTPHACLLPFKLEQIEGNAWKFVDDSDTAALPDWEDLARRIDWPPAEGCFRVHLCEKLVPGMALSGGSFALPLALACGLRETPGFNPLQVVATGRIQNGLVREVNGCEEKRLAALGHGARLFAYCAPEALPEIAGIQCLKIRPGTPLKEALQLIQTGLKEAGILKADIASATETVKRILRAGATGHGNPLQNIPPLESALRVLESSLAAEPLPRVVQLQVKNILLKGLMQLSSLWNHAAQPEHASKVLDRVALTLQTGEDTQSKTLPNHVKCQQAARQIVSWVDQGELEKASVLAEMALEWAQDLPEENNRQIHYDALIAKMELFGAAGGEWCLLKGLRSGNPEDARRSLELMDRNLEYSENLCLAPDFEWRKNLAKSVSRHLLVHAFFDPNGLEQRLREARQKHSALEGWADCEPYLRRTRFLGVYRSRVFGAGPRGNTAWEDSLPMADRGPGAWILATSLKYRAAVRALDGRSAEAHADFSRALELLKGGLPEVIRLIRWSIAAEAFCSVTAVPADIRELLDLDRICATQYLSRLDAGGRDLAFKIKALNFEESPRDQVVQALREFQRGYPY